MTQRHVIRIETNDTFNHLLLGPLWHPTPSDDYALTLFRK